MKPRGCGKLRGVREEVKCRRTGDEETTAALAREGTELHTPARGPEEMSGRRDGVIREGDAV